MIIPDKKKMATMIVAQLHGGPEEEEEAKDGDPSSFEALAGEVMRAVKDGSAADLADALRAFHGACESDYGDSEGEG